jgi:hypothetical protein
VRPAPILEEEVVEEVAVVEELVCSMTYTSHILQNVFVLLFIYRPKMTGYRSSPSLKPDCVFVIFYIWATIWKHSLEIIE